MNKDQRPGLDELEGLIESVNSADNAWNVDDWAFNSDKDTLGAVDLDVSWEPSTQLERGDTRTAKDVIRDIEAEHEKGAPVQTVKRRLYEEHDMKEMETAEVIEKLRTKGEVYEPQQGNLRTT